MCCERSSSPLEKTAFGSANSCLLKAAGCPDPVLHMARRAAVPPCQLAGFPDSLSSGVLAPSSKSRIQSRFLDPFLGPLLHAWLPSVSLHTCECTDTCTCVLYSSVCRHSSSPLCRLGVCLIKVFKDSVCIKRQKRE